MKNKEIVKKQIIKVQSSLESKFGNKYSFRESSYINNHTELEGTCSDHGPIKFTPTSVVFRSTTPCLECRGKVKDTGSFIKKARVIHLDNYSYFLSEYISYHFPLKILCPKHGVFEQRASDHLAGKGCNKCGNNIQTTAEIVNRFKEVHGDTYLYSMVEFSSMHEKVIIICKVHGNFKMKPSDHIFNLQGCSGCASTGFDSTKSAYFYILRVKHKSKIFYKIGTTSKSLKTRYSSSKDKRKIKKCFLYEFSVRGNARKLEAALKKEFKHFLLGENVLLSGNTEIVTIDIRKTKKFKELFNEYKKKDTYN